MYFFIKCLFLALQSPDESGKTKRRCGNYICFILLMRLLALPLLLDKAIAHTNGYAKSHEGCTYQ